MASIVGALGGIKYGAKVYGYFFIVGIVGGILTLAGIGIAVTGLGIPATGAGVAAGGPERLSPNFGRIVLGLATALFGFTVTQAGFVGVIYKIVTDAVYTGTMKSRKDALSGESETDE